MDMSYFGYCQGLRMTGRKFERLFGGPPRRPEGPITEREMDLAASVQEVTEEIMLRSVKHLHGETELKNLCLAGGVALNCVGNGRILREGPFEQVWIQPAAGDAGGALGAALFLWYQLLGNEREVHESDSQRVRFSVRRFRARRSACFWMPRERFIGEWKMIGSCSETWRSCLPPRRWLGGCRGGWSLGLVRWAAEYSR